MNDVRFQAVQSVRKALLPVCLLLAVLVADSRGQTSAPQPVSTPPQEATLRDAIDELYAGRWKQCRRILSSLLPAHSDDPQYFLVYGSASIMGRQDHSAVVALRKARSLQKNPAVANALLALVELSRNRQEEGVRLWLLADRHLADDPAYEYASALAWFLRGEPGRGEEALQQIARNTGPGGVRARERLEEIRTFRKLVGPQQQKAREELAREEAKLNHARSRLAELQSRWEDLEDRKRLLAAEYDRRQAMIQDAYEQARLEIRREFLLRLPPESLETTDPDAYARQVEWAERFRDVAVLTARRQRDHDLHELREEFQPQADEITNTMESVDRQGRSVRENIRSQEDLLERIRPRTERLINRPPIDIDTAWRDAALWLARKPLGMPPLPRPEPTEEEQPDSQNETPPNVQDPPEATMEDNKGGSVTVEVLPRTEDAH